MSPNSEAVQQRQLERLQAKVITDMLSYVGQAGTVLSEKGLGSERIENLAILAVEYGERRAPEHMTTRPTLSVTDEWEERQAEAVVEATTFFATIINTVVSLRDGQPEPEEEEPVE